VRERDLAGEGRAGSGDVGLRVARTMFELKSMPARNSGSTSDYDVKSLVVEVNAGDDLDGNDRRDRPIDHETEWWPPACVGDKLSAVLPEVFEAVAGKADDPVAERRRRTSPMREDFAVVRVDLDDQIKLERAT
jgi:hypothetical protein